MIFGVSIFRSVILDDIFSVWSVHLFKWHKCNIFLKKYVQHFSITQSKPTQLQSRPCSETVLVLKPQPVLNRSHLQKPVHLKAVPVPNMTLFRIQPRSLGSNTTLFYLGRSWSIKSKCWSSRNSSNNEQRFFHFPNLNCSK